jgi:hypothetical protein
MFARFRIAGRRLHVSVVETRRQGSKVRHEHIASLGSIPLTMSAADRVAFWTKLHQRLDAPSNRIDAAKRGAILTAIHARIPMPTMDDQQEVQLDRAKADAKFWESLADAQGDDIEGHKGLLASTQRAISEREKAAAGAAEKVRAAKDRLARVEAGETVAVPPPLTRKDFLRITGMTEAEARHCEQVHDMAARGPDWWQFMIDEQMRRGEQAEKAVVRRLHRVLREP